MGAEGAVIGATDDGARGAQDTSKLVQVGCKMSCHRCKLVHWLVHPAGGTWGGVICDKGTAWVPFHTQLLVH